MKASTKPTSVLRTAVTMIVGLAASALQAADPGDLDPSFGTGGIVSTGDVSAREYAQQVIVRPNGKIVAVGVASNRFDDDFAALQFDPTGAPDPSFGTNGMVKIPIGSPYDQCHDAALQADGKIVMVGSTADGDDLNLALVRLGVTGQLDPTFGTGGIVIISPPGVDGTNVRMAIQEDGRILVCGRLFAPDGSFDTSLAVFRFTSSGALDPTFDGDGIVSTNLGGTRARATDIVIQEDGRIVVAGHLRTDDPYAAYSFVLLRFTESGALDPTFGSAGIVLTPVGTGIIGEALGLQADGKIVVAGQRVLSEDGEIGAFGVARYTRTGALDPSFGNGGIAITRIGNGYDGAHSLAIQTDGKIIATGESQTLDTSVIAMVRYTTTGALDRSFSDDGIATTRDGYSTLASSCALQSNGSVVVVGGSVRGPDVNFTIARYLAGVPRPDARIGPRSVPRGNNLYDPNRDGQTLRATLRPGRSKTIQIGIQNDSDTAAVFKIRGKRGNRSFKVRYLDGTNDVTKSVVSGSFITRLLEPGEIARLSVEVLAKSGQSGRSRMLSVRATAEDGLTRDTVRIEAEAR